MTYRIKPHDGPSLQCADADAFMRHLHAIGLEPEITEARLLVSGIGPDGLHGRYTATASTATGFGFGRGDTQDEAAIRALADAWHQAEVRT